jgi:hypothetical protein
VTGERRRFAGGALLLLAACEGGFLPLRGKIEVGRDPMVVFVGGPAASSDLYALPADGGRAIAITSAPSPSCAPHWRRTAGRSPSCARAHWETRYRPASGS